MSDTWRPTHCLLAQRVRLLGRADDRYLVEYPDGSQGWIDGWPYQNVMVPIELAEREGLNV